MAAHMYRGFTIEPSYKSPHGTGRMCQTVQGWRIKAPVTADHFEQWAETIKRAKQRVDVWYDLLPQALDPSRSKMLNQNFVRAAQQLDNWLAAREGTC